MFGGALLHRHRRREVDTHFGELYSVTVKIEPIPVKVVDRELPQSHGFRSSGSTIFAPDDRSSSYVASMPAANTQ